ncbi:MAG: non-heme iron oxygenase ferredoxin subunit [Candidatus Nitrosotalea sp.]|nr:non-heme iron oxygenase ferredoxin subunit [Candidatus Nitrosotalea sp.]
MGKIIVGKVSDFIPGKMQKITIDGKDVLVANIDGTYYAINDTCTHAGASLSEGSLDGTVVTCGWHGAKFDCKTGKLSSFPAKIKDLNSYKVVVESENIFVEV